MRARTRADRLLVVFSDVEMGPGGAYDDFPNSGFLGELLLSYAAPAYEGYAIDIVFNGDTFDLLKTSVDGVYPRHVSVDVALRKLDRVAQAHPQFFASVRELLARTGPRGRVSFVVGNHDPELLFPEVQAAVRRLCGGERVVFPGLSLDIGRVHIEHGSQVDPLFQMDAARPFIEYRGERLLNLTWATVALLDVVIPLQPLLYHHDRLKPRQLLLALIPEIKELLTGAFWEYWTRDYWRDVLRGSDPMKGVSWTMLKELVRRLVTWDPDITMGDDFQRRLVASDRYDLYLVGHQHEPGLWSHGHRKVIRTGAMRDEFMLDADGAIRTQINKSYAEVLLAGGEVVRSQLVEQVAPPRPEGTMPRSIFEVVPCIRELLADRERRARQRVAQVFRGGPDRW